MSFSENMAQVVADQMERFVTLNRHQLAGHVANLDFWIAQTRHVLQVIDGYQERFRRLKAGQADHVATHGTTVLPPFGPDHIGSPELPRRMPDSDLRNARRAAADATCRFLVRLCHDRLIPEAQLRSLCDSLNIGVATADLPR